MQPMTMELNEHIQTVYRNLLKTPDESIRPDVIAREILLGKCPNVFDSSIAAININDTEYRVKLTETKEMVVDALRILEDYNLVTQVLGWWRVKPVTEAFKWSCNQ